MLQSHLCDYNDAFIIVKGTITVTGDNNRERKIGLWHLKAILHLLIAYQRSIMY